MPSISLLLEYQIKKHGQRWYVNFLKDFVAIVCSILSSKKVIGLSRISCHNVDSLHEGNHFQIFPGYWNE